MLKKILFSLVPLLVVGLALTAPHVEAGVRCVVQDGPCKAGVEFTPFNGVPTIPCQNTEQVYEATFTIKCAGPPVIGVWTASEYVCSGTNFPVSFTFDGQTHTLQPAAGSDWGDVIADCSKLVYTRS